MNQPCRNFMKKLMLLAAVLCVLVGCSTYGTVTKNLATDGAVVRADLNSPWGNQNFIRIGTTTNTVHVTEKGDIWVNGEKK